MKKVRYGIVGIGKQGSYYTQILTKMKFLVKGAELAAISDLSEDRREWARKTLPSSLQIFEDYKEMFQSGLIDAVIIATPHYAHPVIAQEAFEAGLHVISDKPAGVYTKQVREMNEAAAKHPELQFGMMLNQRTNPIYIKAKEIISSGQLGRMKRIIWIVTDWYRPQAYYDQGGWRGTWEGEGGGVLINQCPHQLDLFTWLAGQPVSVRATAKTSGRNINVENDVTASCTFESGAEGVFIASTHDSPGTNRLEIVGDGGKIVIEHGRLTFKKNAVLESDFSASNEKFMSSTKYKTKRYRGIGRYMRFIKYPAQHAGILKNYTDCLLGKDKTLIAPGAEGITGLTFSNAIHLSSWLGKEVKVPLDEELFIQELNKRIAEEKGDQ